jgi:hydroxyacylglutathione hydrolase
MPSLYLKQLAVGPMQNFVYLIGDPVTKEAAVVDPAWNVPAILKQVKEDGYKLTHVLLSHGHYDHINGVEDVLDKTDATVCAQGVELDQFIPEGAGGLVIPKSSLKKTASGNAVRVGNLDITLIHTPGHTPGSQCMLIKGPDAGSGILITGDTLFVGTCGRCDLPYSDPDDLFHSLGQLKKLDDGTVFYPGHDYGATPTNTLKNEKRTNPFLLADSIDQFLQMVHH